LSPSNVILSLKLDYTNRTIHSSTTMYTRVVLQCLVTLNEHRNLAVEVSDVRRLSTPQDFLTPLLAAMESSSI
jgi:hypothetical protein